MEEQNNLKYKAFISYRHKPLDKAIAQKVHSSIEHYVIPRSLRTSHDVKHLGRVFRDEEELPATGDLSDSIQYALENSEYLIVICSPDTPESQWVSEEIRRFRGLHGHDHIIAVLIDGTPDESFPPELLKSDDDPNSEEPTIIEPLAANLTDEEHHHDKQRFRREIVRIYAAIIGCSYDKLWQREHRYRMRRIACAIGAAFAVVITFGVSMYIKNLQISERNRQIEEQNTEIQKKNNEIELQNEEILEQNKELQTREADTLIRESELLYDRGDVYEAADRVVEAMSSEAGKKAYASEAEYLLNKYLGIGDNSEHLRTVRCIDQKTDVVEIRLSNDGKRVYTLDERGVVRCFDCNTGELKWDADASVGKYSYELYSPQRKRLLLAENSGILVCCGKENISALSLSDGTIKWIHFYNEDTQWSKCSEYVCMNEDGTELAVIDAYEDVTGIMKRKTYYNLDFINAEDGRITKRFRLPDFFCERNITVHGNDFGAFLPEEHCFGGVFYSEESIYGDSDNDADMIHYFIVDFENNEIKLASADCVTPLFSTKSFVIGTFFYKNEVDQWPLFAFCYDPEQLTVTVNGFAGNDNKIETVYKFDTTVDYSEKRYYLYQFQSDFWIDESRRIMATCGPMEYYIYQDNGQTWFGSKKCSDDIIKFIYPHEYESESVIRLLKNGHIESNIKGGWAGEGPFSEHSHIYLMNITPNFAIENGDNGYTIPLDTVAVLVPEDAKNTICVLNPCKDPLLNRISINHEIDHKSEFYRIDDQIFAVYNYDFSLNRAYIHLIDSKTGKAIRQNEVESSEGLLAGISQIEFWADSKHFSVRKSSSGDVVIGDMITGEVIRFSVNNNYGKQLTAISDCKNGICAAIVDLDEKTLNLLNKDLVEESISIDTDSINENLIPKEVIIGDNGLVIITLNDSNDESVFYYVYSIKDSHATLIPSETNVNGSSSHLVVAGNENKIFADICESKLFIYNAEENQLLNRIELELSYHNVVNAQFFNDDHSIAIWTDERELLIYDLQSGQKVYDEYIELLSSDSTEISMSLFENKEKKRVYVRFSDNRGICIELENYNKVMDIPQIAYYSVGADAIYLNTITLSTVSSDYVLYYNPYSLSDLIERTNSK